jgi:hypothetical protein
LAIEPVLLTVVFQRYAVFFRESNKIVPMYAVLSTRQAEGNQITFFNPPQDGHLTDAAVSSDDSGCKVLGDISLYLCIQGHLLYSSSFFLMANSIYLLWI